MPFVKKVNEYNFNEIKQFCSKNNNDEVKRVYGIGHGTIWLVRNSNSYQEYITTIREKARERYIKRKQKIKKEVSAMPFTNALEPKPVIPLQDNSDVSPHGPVVTTTMKEKLEKLEERIPFSLEDYRESYKELQALNKDLVTQTQELQSSNNQLKAEVARLEKGLSKETQARYDAECDNQELIATKVEITVGDAHIVVSKNSDVQ